MNESFFNIKLNSKENNLLRDNPTILRILLKDRTTQGNLVWGTESYALLGDDFKSEASIKIDLITKDRVSLIRPRVAKEWYEQKARTKDRAEVYTPTWLVKKQTDIVDSEFSELSLEEYISKSWLEITCGEAPYMASRYDTVTGNYLKSKDRVGFVDRKLKRINKDVNDETYWYELVKKAYQTSYGYEFQGDSLLLARENLLYTFIDFYEEKFNKEPSVDQEKEIAKIISYNIFQMNGLDYTVPYTEVLLDDKNHMQLNLFGEPEEPHDIQLDLSLTGQLAKIKDWKTNKMIEIKSFVGRESNMKFDVIIGNPPYQEEAKGTSSKDMPIYHKFMDEAYRVGEKVLLITPARFLSNAGGTPKSWNIKMLNDDHLKVSFFEQDSSRVFENTDIKGGVAVTYRDSGQNFGAIEVFTPFTELKSILSKIEQDVSVRSFSEIVSNRGLYRYADKIYDDYPGDMKQVSDRRLASNAFNKLKNHFYDTKPDDKFDYVQIYGRYKNKRVFKWFRKDYLNSPYNFETYKVILPKANGSGAIGEVLSTPLIGYTETFLGIGAFVDKSEAQAVYKYIKSKFARAMLGILKITQDNTKTTWEKVPLQDFTEHSDIDWTKSVAEIDQQLYKKYELSEEEINFIETKVKEMD